MQQGNFNLHHTEATARLRPNAPTEFEKPINPSTSCLNCHTDTVSQCFFCHDGGLQVCRRMASASFHFPGNQSGIYLKKTIEETRIPNVLAVLCIQSLLKCRILRLHPPCSLQFALQAHKHAVKALKTSS